MDVNVVKTNSQGINLKPSNPQATKKNQENFPMFSTVEWVNKNDGNTYVAKKIKLTQNGKELPGIYVYRKDAKPDEKGNIQGEFMSVETFFKKIGDEVPAINSDTAKSYFPNIKDVKNDTRIQPKKPISLDEIIDQSVKLPDGSIILHPTICGSTNEIKKDENGHYTLTTTGTRMGSVPTTRKITPQEIVTNKWLCGGTIKKIGEDQYEVRYPAGGDPKNGIEKAIFTEAECKEFMKSQNVLTYLK